MSRNRTAGWCGRTCLGSRELLAVIGVVWAGSVLGLAASPEPALAPGSVDPTFMPATYGAVSHFALQPDGRVVVVMGRKLLRLNRNGSLDPSLNVEVAGGIMTERVGLDGTTRNVDMTSLNAIAVQTDGRILIGGQFTTVDGVPAQAVARLNINGSVDAAFEADLTGGPRYVDQLSGDNVSVQSISLLPEHRILVGGLFYNADGQPRSHVALLRDDGSLDEYFDPGSGVLSWPVPGLVSDTASVLAVGRRSDGKIYVAGHFYAFDNVLRFSLALLEEDGSVDLGFAPRLGGSMPTVSAVVAQSNGHLLVAGSFVDLETGARTNLMRLDLNGRVDRTFDAELGAPDTITALVLQPNGKILIAGSFQSIQGYVRDGLARLHSDGSLDLDFMPRLGTNVVAQLVSSQDTVLIGGAFSQINGVPRNGLARLFAASVDVPQAPRLVLQPEPVTVSEGQSFSLRGYAVGFPPPTYQWWLNGQPLAGATDRHLDVSEAFPSHAGLYSLTVWNDSGGATSPVQTVTVRTTPHQAGSIDPGFAAQVPANPGALRVLTVLANGNYAAAFAKVPGQVPGRVVQFRKDGAVESQVQLNFGADELDWPEVVSILADGKLVLVATQLFRATGEGTLEVTYDTAGLVLDNSPAAYAALPDGKLVLVSTGSKVMRFNIDGSQDGTFHGGVSVNLSGKTGPIQIQALPDGGLLLAGAFTAADGVTCPGLTRLMPDGGVDLNFLPALTGPSPGPLVSKALPYGKKQILIAGAFSSIDGLARIGLARLNLDGTLDASFDPGDLLMHPAAVVQAWQVQPDGKLVIAAGVSNAPARLVRLSPNGAPDAGFVANVEWSGAGAARIDQVAVDWPERIVIGGAFDRVNGMPSSILAALYISARSGPDSPVNFRYSELGYTFTLPSTLVGQRYTVEVADNLTTPVWSSLTSFSGDGLVKVVQDTNAPNRQRFYRIKAE